MNEVIKSTLDNIYTDNEDAVSRIEGYIYALLDTIKELNNK
jgi:hypothetical protein